MPLLRKTGVRSAWLPGPLQGSIERVRPALVVAALAPAILLGGTTAWTGQPARVPNTTPPAAPARVVQQPVPVPGASVWTPTPAHLTPVAKLATSGPAVITPSPQPPAASFWAPRPLDPGVVAPQDKLSPVSVQVNQPPIPTAIARATAAPRDQVAQAPDRLAITQVVSGAQPQPGASPRTVGIVHDGDRLSPTVIGSGQQPIPPAQALPIGSPRHTPFHRPAPTRCATGAPPLPLASVHWIRAPRLSTAGSVVIAGSMSGSGHSGTTQSSSRAGSITTSDAAGEVGSSDRAGSVRSPSQASTI